MGHPLLDTDVYRRIGGQAALTQLLDPQGRGAWDVASLDDAMGDAWNYVVAAVGVQVELTGLTNDQIRAQYGHLITLASQKSLKLTWTYGTAGQACPQKITELDEAAEKQLELLALRRRKHGNIGVSPTPSQAVGQIDRNPNHDRITLEGFMTSGGLI